jgi:uncharacterized membrane protein
VTRLVAPAVPAGAAGGEQHVAPDEGADHLQSAPFKPRQATLDELRICYFAVTALRELVLINFYALVGQGILYVLAGQGREQNMFYRIIKLIASPAMWLARRLAPKFVVDRHIPWVALFLVIVLGIALTVAQQILIGMAAQPTG